MEVVRKPGNGTVPFATVAIGDVFAADHDVLYQRVKVPGDDGEYAADLSTGIVHPFDRGGEVRPVAGHFEET